MNMESIEETPSQPSQIEDSLENRLSQSSLKWFYWRKIIYRRHHENVHENTKRVEVEETTTQRPVNVFKRTQYESPVKKSLLGQIHSVVVIIWYSEWYLESFEEKRVVLYSIHHCL